MPRNPNPTAYSSQPDCFTPRSTGAASASFLILALIVGLATFVLLLLTRAHRIRFVRYFHVALAFTTIGFFLALAVIIWMAGGHQDLDTAVPPGCKAALGAGWTWTMLFDVFMIGCALPVALCSKGALLYEG